MYKNGLGTFANIASITKMVSSSGEVLGEFFTLQIVQWTFSVLSQTFPSLHAEKTIEWVLPYQQYQDQLVDQAALMLTLSGRVNETKQVLANQTTFRLRTPDLTVTVSFWLAFNN